MPRVPHDPALDSTLFLLRDGYEFLWKRHQRLQSEIFTLRFMGRKAISIHGPEAARLFYDPSRFQRHGALPRRVVTSLFGKQAIHTLDGAPHVARKAAFMRIMGPKSLEDLMRRAAQEWRDAVRAWAEQRTVNLFEESQRLLTRAVCGWAGVPLVPSEEALRARLLGQMVDAFGGVGPRLWKGKLARVSAERWIGGIIHAVRRGAWVPKPDSALAVMAHLVDHRGRLLSERVAAVELLNILRPTVAISWYIIFAALALHRHPEAQARLIAESARDSAGEYADLFMQEVRRFYPFTPFLGAKVKRPFAWKEQQFAPGTMVLLDIYGANHDPRYWEAPEQFEPERFRHWNGDAFDFTPQGGGEVRTGHRCPGEWITMHNVALALHFLTRCMRYQVVAGQDLSFSLPRMPTRPASGFLIQSVAATPALDQPAPVRPSLFAAYGNEAVKPDLIVPAMLQA